MLRFTLATALTLLPFVTTGTAIAQDSPAEKTDAPQVSPDQPTPDQSAPPQVPQNKPTPPPAVPDQGTSEKPDVPVIPDEPKAVDPAGLVPPKLAVKATADFQDSSLKQLAAWIRTEQGIPVILDTKALTAGGILAGEPVNDELIDAPIYQLLNRLRSIKLTWYVDDGVLHITTLEAAAERMSTTAYNVSDLLDAEFDPDVLTEVILEGVFALWEEVDGEGGSVQWLGDVLFIRQTDAVHRRIRGLLAALRKHARRTFTFDPPEHNRLREKLTENVTVDFDDTPLVSAAAELAQLTGTDIRLDTGALRDARIRDREPVTLALADRSLSTVLDVLLADLGLTWALRDGVLWITSRVDAESETHHLTAVYDVRDLCRDDEEADALQNAIESQTGRLWLHVDGEGGTIQFAKPGTMVVRHDEPSQSQVTQLLDAYRQALRVSKARTRADEDDEVLIRFYRMEERVAAALHTALPQLVKPSTWRSPQNTDAVGAVQMLASSSAVMAAPKKGEATASGILTHYSVLMITQSRGVHKEIARLVSRVETGDAPLLEGGGGLGGGGFGGGFFSVPPREKRARRQR